jgi:serine/threonine protein phosphatase 1
MRQAEPRPASTPAGTRIYAIGDIHGRLDLLTGLHGLIAEHAARSPAARRLLVYVGDYIDRGPDSAGVLDLLLDHPLAGFETVHLLGNHEDSMLQFTEDLSIGPAWFNYGGLDTLRSYGVEIRFDPGRDAQELRRLQIECRRRVPRRHVEFLRKLPLMHVEGEYAFAHAGIRPGVAIDRQVRDDVLWIRDEFLHSTADHGKVVVHGHTISFEPEERSNRIGIDTGAFWSDRLTCLVLDGTERAFLQT